VLLWGRDQVIIKTVTPGGTINYLGANKSLARPGRKQAAPVKNVMGRGMD